MSLSLRARPALATAVLAVACALSGAVPASAAPGDLDPSYGTGGRVLDPSAKGTGDVIAQAGNKAVIQRAATSSDRKQLQRYSAAGELDPTFGVGGLSEATSFDEQYPSPIATVQQDEQGRLVTATDIRGTTFGIALARYTPDGMLDDTFDEDGMAAFSGGQDIEDMDLAPDGKVVTVGFAYNGYYSGRDIRVDRFYADGSGRDASFNGGGVVTLHPVDNQGAACRGTGVFVQSDGKVVVTGECGNGDVFAQRLNENGTLDQDFGAGKVDLKPFVSVTEIAAGPEGTVLLAGRIDDPALEYDAGDFGLLRLTPSGARDSAFADGEIVRTPVTGSCDEPRELIVQPDGKVLTIGYAAGCSGTKTMTGIARHDATGALDTSFGGDGIVTQAHDGEWNEPFAAALQPNGGLLVAADSTPPGGPGSASLARFETGIVVPSGELRFDPEALAFPSTEVGATSAPKALTITNDTGSTIDIGEIAFTGPFYADNAEKCFPPIDHGGSCTIDIRFKPNITGANDGVMKVFDEAERELGVYGGLSGTATGGPAAGLSAVAVDLGMGEMGKPTASKPVTLTNTGNTTMQVDKAEFAGPFGGSTADCVGDLPAGAQCKVDVALIADAQGPLKGALRFFADVPGKSVEVALTGIGLKAGAASDGSDPVISIAAPVATTRAVVGSPGPAAAFTCSDSNAGDSGVRKCEGFDGDRQVTADEVLDTSAAGTRTFRVEASDWAGRKQTASVIWEVVPATPTPAPPAPVPGRPGGSAKYSVLLAGDVIAPKVPFVLPDGNVVDACNADGTFCFLASVCNANEAANQYDPAACAALAEKIRKASLTSAVDWQARSLPGGMSGFAIGSAVPTPRWGIRDAGSNVIATGDGNVISTGGGNVISTGGGNLSVKAGKIWIPPGVKVQVRKAGTVIDLAGNVISTGGGNLIGQAGGNFVFAEDGWQATRDGVVVASGSGKVISTGGGNVISTGGGNVISTGGGNLIGQAGGNLIGQAGGNVISTGGGNLIGQAGGNVISTGGGNAVLLNRGSFSALGPEALPASLTSFIEYSFSNAEVSTQLLALSVPGGAAARASARKKPRRVVIARSRLSVKRPGVYRSTMTLTRTGRKLIRRLRKKGKKARLTLESSLKPNGGKPIKAGKKVTVKVRRR